MRLLTISMISVVFLLFACGEQSESKQQAQQKSEQEKEHKMTMTTTKEDTLYFTCPMEEHKHIHSDKPGKCPECNMDLVAVVETIIENKEYYGCSMAEHSHVRHDEPGKCEECGMDLKPMRLQK